MVQLLAACVLVLVVVVIVLMRRLQRAHQRNDALQDKVADLGATKVLLQAQASHDSLTGLGNRRLLGDRFFLAVERSKRSGKPFALLMIDLDNFKGINDKYGHVAGDDVLIATARRLVTALRASDTVSRLGGDEFVLLMEALDDSQDLRHIRRKLIHKLSEEIQLEGGQRISVGASAGYALYPEHGTNISELLRIADRAMYDCKASGFMALSEV